MNYVKPLPILFPARAGTTIPMAKLATFVRGRPKKSVSTPCSSNGRTKLTSVCKTFAGTPVLGLAFSRVIRFFSKFLPAFVNFDLTTLDAQRQNPAAWSLSRADLSKLREISLEHKRTINGLPQKFWRYLSY